MKVALRLYLHSENGLAVEVSPETDAELEVLKAMAKWGKLSLGGRGELIVEWKFNEPKKDT